MNERKSIRFYFIRSARRACARPQTHTHTRTHIHTHTNTHEHVRYGSVLNSLCIQMYLLLFLSIVVLTWSTDFDEKNTDLIAVLVVLICDYFSILSSTLLISHWSSVVDRSRCSRLSLLSIAMLLSICISNSATPNAEQANELGK